MATLILGGITIENCKPVLLVGEKEVFRLHQRAGDGHLVVDFELCDEQGRSIATVARNVLAQAKPGIAVRHGPAFSEVVLADGAVIGRAEETTAGVLRIVGRFGAAGAIVHAKSDVLELPGAGTMRGCTLTASGVPVAIDARGALSLGGPAQPVVRPGFRPNMPAPQLKQQGKRRRS